jgi:hypothetical protein
MIGCARSTVSESLVESYNGPDQELEYFAELEELHTVSNNDALHTLFLLADSVDAHADYPARASEAVRRGWLPENKVPEANTSAQIGLVSVALCDILEIPGGLSLRLSKNSPRYATRELVFMGLLPPRTENQSISGLELIDLVGRADRLLTQQSRATPASS